MISQETITLLNNLSNKFETADFIVGDPSWFMHQVKSQPDKEATAFVAAAL